MDLSNLIVEVRTASLERVGVILPDDLDLDALVLQNDVGSWSCTISSKHPVAEALMAPGAGILVTDSTTGDALFSGPTLPTNTDSVDGLGDTITVTGVTDEQVLDDMLAWPDPASGDLASQASAFDERTGPSETLMHEFVNVNAGPLAAAERYNLRVTEGEDLARGEVVTKAARFNNLLGLLQDLAEPDGITFRMVQIDGKLELETSLKPDQGRVVRLDTGLDTVVSSRFSQTPPGLTRALVGGRGGNASRKFHEAVSDDALEAEEDWGRRIEKFVDRQDARQDSDLERVGSESLTIDGGSTQGARIEPSEALCASFGEAWSLGDTVSVASGGSEHVVPVTGVILKIKNSRLRIGALLGQSDAVRLRRDQRRSSIVNDAAHEERLWEDDDPHVLTSGEVTAGLFQHPLKFSKTIEKSMQVSYVKPLPRDNFDVDLDTGVLTVNLFGTELAGDRFDLHYQYVPSPPAAPIGPQIVVPNGPFNTYGLEDVVEVGGTTPLADDSDTTSLYWNAAAMSAAANCTIGLSLLESYSPGDPITLHIRMAVTGGGDLSYVHGEVFIATDTGASNNEIAGFSNGAASGFGFSIPAANGTIVDLTIPLSLGAWGGTTAQDVADALMAGAYLDINAIVNAAWDTPPTATVYKAWITVGGGS